jgi:hypothetical protein
VKPKLANRLSRCAIAQLYPGRDTRVYPAFAYKVRAAASHFAAAVPKHIEFSGGPACCGVHRVVARDCVHRTPGRELAQVACRSDLAFEAEEFQILDRLQRDRRRLTVLVIHVAFAGEAELTPPRGAKRMNGERIRCSSYT